MLDELLNSRCCISLSIAFLYRSNPIELIRKCSNKIKKRNLQSKIKNINILIYENSKIDFKIVAFSLLFYYV